MSVFEENYKWLLDYQQQKKAFFVSDLGCGMKRYKSRGWGDKGLIIANEKEGTACPLVWPDGELGDVFENENFCWEQIAAIGYDNYARRRKVDYRLDISRYQDGMARVYWMLNPDGSYFADEDGYGRSDDEEVYICAYIDTHFQVVKPFQPEDL